MAKREYSMKIYFVENEQIKELMQGTVKMVDYLHSMHGQPHAFIKETFDKVFDSHERPFVCLSHNEI
jgi:hypothetical protein